MITHLFITSATRARIENSRQPQFIKHVQEKSKKGACLTGKLVPKHPYYLEQPQKKSAPRYLWKEVVEENVKICVLRDCILHDEYTEKYNGGNIGKWSEQTKYAEFSEAEKAEIHAEALRIQREAKEGLNQHVELAELSDAENLFLREALNINKDIYIDTIFERKSWIQAIEALAKNNETSFTSNYGISLKDEIEKHLGEDTPVGWLKIPVQHTNNQAIAVYKQKDPQNPEYYQWVLFDIIKNDENPEDVYNIDEIYDREGGLLHGCRRSYSAFELDDMDRWQGIEQDKYGNIILSGEENNILTTSQQYPIFLSGRAGSGKSTVLQFLFAEVLLRYLKVSNSQEEGVDELGCPAYISYSEKLISSAKELTESLFTKNENYCEVLKDNSIDYQEDVAPLIDNDSFLVFSQIVRDSIAGSSESEALAGFDLDNRISFSRFKYLWEKKFGKSPEYKSYPPSLCWHVIKTFIKGWDSKEYLTPEKYDNIGRENKTVTQKHYKFIFEKIWEKWYKSFLSQGLWDDQDIVRFCLHPNDSGESYVTPRFSAIFCDEAQDFTRVELEFILKLSVFTTKIIPDDLGTDRIPFVFAGDEFQTLSPTGFSWDSLRSSFKEKLCEALQLDKSKVFPREPMQLNNNYRSTPSIVKLGNRLQLLRASRFGQPSLPQQTYFTD